MTMNEIYQSYDKLMKDLSNFEPAEEISMNYVFDDDLTIAQNRRLINEYNAKVRELKENRIKAVAEAVNTLRTNVRVLMFNSGCNPDLERVAYGLFVQRTGYHPSVDSPKELVLYLQIVSSLVCRDPKTLAPAKPTCDCGGNCTCGHGEPGKFTSEESDNMFDAYKSITDIMKEAKMGLQDTANRTVRPRAKAVIPEMQTTRNLRNLRVRVANKSNANKSKKSPSIIVVVYRRNHPLA